MNSDGGNNRGNCNNNNYNNYNRNNNNYTNLGRAYEPFHSSYFVQPGDTFYEVLTLIRFGRFDEVLEARDALGHARGLHGVHDGMCPARRPGFQRDSPVRRLSRSRPR